MKRIVTSLALLVGVAGYAQSTDYTKTSHKQHWTLRQKQRMVVS